MVDGSVVDGSMVDDGVLETLRHRVVGRLAGVVVVGLGRAGVVVRGGRRGVLVGSGAYEGLSAFLVFDFKQDPASVVGVIFPGELPPMATFVTEGELPQEEVAAEAPVATFTEPRVVDVAELDERTRDLTIESPSVGEARVRLLLPAGFGDAVILRPFQGVEIDYVAGYGADPAEVPATLRQALLLLVAYWFENRDAVVLAGTGSVVPSGFDQIVGAYRSIRL